MPNRTVEGNRVFLTGTLDENFSFPEFPQHPEVIIDLSGISKINSVGITKWIGFFDNKNAEAVYIFEKVPTCIINQINMIQGFVSSRSRITSFFVPIFNSDSEEEVNFLLQHPEDVKVKDSKIVFRANVSEILPPGFEFDISDFGYFRFLTKINS